MNFNELCNPKNTYSHFRTELRFPKPTLQGLTWERNPTQSSRHRMASLANAAFTVNAGESVGICTKRQVFQFGDFQAI
jgi:hypothetical protein